MDKKIKLTDAIVDDIAFYLGREHLIPGRPGVTTYPPRADTMDAWRIVTAVLSHPDAAGLFECDYTDYVHVDEAAARVEAAREQGWDQATRWIDSYQGGPNGRTTSARLANPYRPTLPTTDGAVIVPAEGREFIEAEVAGQTFIAREAVVCESDFGPANVLEGAWRRADTGARVGGQVSRDFITPGTWQVEGE